MAATIASTREIRSGAANALRARALRVKRHNAVTAVLAGAALAAPAVPLHAVAPLRFAPLAFALGLAAGVLYANGFEYLLHRFFLHWGDGFLVQRHALHHDSLGTIEEPRYINFATSPWVVVLVFAANAAPVFGGLFLLGLLQERGWGAWFPAGALGAGIFAGFTAYFVIYEEVHWRIHMGGWLPRWMAFARRHHLLHHRRSEGYYNVFLPIFDWLFTRTEDLRAESPRTENPRAGRGESA